MATPAYMPVTAEKQGPITAGAFTAESVGNTYRKITWPQEVSGYFGC